MRGYLSFVIVFVCVFILLSLFLAKSELLSADFSKSIVAERMHQTSMNIKQGIFAAAESGGKGAFVQYDFTHSRDECVHCPDMGCVPPTPENPTPPNVCDPVRCSICFRDEEARILSAAGAQTVLNSVADSDFEFGHSIWCGKLSNGEAGLLAKETREKGKALGGGAPASSCVIFDAELTPDLLSENGVRLSRIRTLQDIGITLYSEKHDISSVSKIPAGMVVEIE